MHIYFLQLILMSPLWSACAIRTTRCVPFSMRILVKQSTFSENCLTFEYKLP